MIIPPFLLLYEPIAFTSKGFCSLQCHRAEVLIPFPLPLCLDTATSVFHHPASETQENTGQTKTSLNVRRANKAGAVTEGSVAAARSGMEYLENKDNPTASPLGMEALLSELRQTEENNHALLQILSVFYVTTQF